MKTIELTKGYFASVDDIDYERVIKHSWYTEERSSGNVVCHYARSRIFGKLVYMHRFIISDNKEMQIDHIDFNGLNNTRGNLRVCNGLQNSQSRRKRIGCLSKYKGISIFVGRRKKWRASIKHNGKCICLGYYESEKEAAIKYNDAAIKYFGHYAVLNKVD